MPLRPTISILLLTATLVLSGCKDRQITAYRAPKDPVVQPAVAPTGALPADHPPIGAGASAPAPTDGATMANTAVPTAGGTDLKWSAPTSWTTKAGSAMRKGSYAVKRDGAEADFAITAFPGDTGGLHANINRWRGQVGLSPASPAELDAAVQHLDGQGLHFDVVELAGPSGTRLLGAITSHNGNSWFFKLMGPDAVVAAEKATFLGFLQTVQAPEPMNDITRQFRDFFVSLQLTVVLLILSLLLVFVATLDQVNLGIWAVQEKYFRSFFVMWRLPESNFSLPVFPGGYFIGGLLLINLIAAHIYRFSLTWRKLGIQLTHIGLIVLLVGELVTGILQKDSSMRLEEGQTKAYSESFRDHELALIDRTDPAFDEVVAIPEAVLADQKSLQHPKLPFQVSVKTFYANATMQMGDPSGRPGDPVATQGIGTRVQVLPLPLTYKPDEINLPAAFVEIIGPAGSLGTWAVSPVVGMPQTFIFEGRTWEIALRLKRHYYPFSINLLQVTHDKYPGTEIPKNFASRIRLKDEAGHEDREVVIFMNNPLRHGGHTFYQYQMNAAGKMSAFQVVRNPGWLLPYIACILMGIGLTWQFSYSLLGFIRKRTTASAVASSV